MSYRLLADIVLLLHAAFVAYTLFGGLLVLRFPKLLWLHLPVLLWGVAVQWADWICPLTPLENSLRSLAGESGYPGDFLEFWILRILYPEHLTIELRYLLGILLIAFNVVVYLFVVARKYRDA